MRTGKPKFVRWRTAGILLTLVFLWGAWEGYVGKFALDPAVDTWRFEGVKREEARSDTYGGETPQETLDLFIAALEKRDFELAVKYFVEEERENFVTRSASTPEERLSDVIDGLRSATPQIVYPNSAYYDYSFGNDGVAGSFSLMRNERNGRWKLKGL